MTGLTPFSKKKHFFQLIILLSILIATGGYTYYRYQAEEIKKNKYKDLENTAHLKMQQIIQWHKERMSEVVFFSENPNFISYISRMLNNEQDDAERNYLRGRLSHIQKTHGYHNIFVLRPSQEVLFSLNKVALPLQQVTKAQVAVAFGKKQIQTTGFYKDSGKIFFDFIAPVINQQGTSIAVLVFRIDPDSFLYPLIQERPSESKTTESLIARKEGDSALFLNELRHTKNSALNLKISLNNTEIPVVKAIRGHHGIWEGEDYRGEKVLSYTQPIEGLPWFMVTKVDTKEIYAPLYGEMISIALFVILGILFMVAAVAFIYSYNQRNILRKLLYAQEEYRTTLQSIGDAVIATDNKGYIQYINPIAEKLTGWKEQDAKELPLEHVFRIINENTRQKVESPVQKVLQNGLIVGLANHTLLISKKGDEVPIADSGAPIKNEENEIEGVVLVFRDQTKEREQQRELESSEKKYRTIFSESPVGIFYYDEQGIIIECNAKFTDIIGATRDQLVGLNMPEQLNDKKLLESVIQSLRDGEAYYEDLYRAVSSGKETFVKVFFRGIPDESGRISSGIGLVEDISKQKEAEHSLKTYAEIQEILTGISTKYINVPIDKIDKAIEDGLREMGDHVQADRAFVFEYDHQKQVASNAYEWCAADIKSHIDAMKEIPFDSIPDWVVKHGKGETIYIPDVEELPQGELKELLTQQNIKSRVTVPMMHKGDCIGFVGFDAVKQYRDYTQTEQILLEVFSQILVNFQMRNKVERELRTAKEKAEESNRLKTAFLANMNHEIRTPMNGIMGFTDLLKDRGLTGSEQQHYITMIEKSGNRMLSTINDLIDISKIEAGQMQVIPEDVNINQRLDELYTFFKPETEAKGVEFSIYKDLPDNDAVIHTDGKKLESVLINLIKNAVKFTHAGRIDIGYKIRAQQIVFYVKDTGIGIPKERQSAVFDRFIQADVKDKNAYQGSGLGLSISQAYVNMMGGEINLESEVNKGSSFYLTIPHNSAVEIKSQQSDSKEWPSIKQNLKILIVEDDEATDLYLTEILKNMSRQIQHASTGEEALEHIQNDDIDVILMDVKLPEMDGYAITRRVRETNSHVVIIAQTAYAMKGDREKALDAGCDDYIAKPLKKEELLRLITKHVALRK